ncbi:MAG TPA: hypothetical protein VFE53_02380 [Mucilaginibacter sp.]|jgi:hypothetical protein|nr:hypothetical protein [Mucilaginibacter sp.]
MNLTPIQKLDLVLGILAEDTENTSVYKIVLKSGEKISADNTVLVLKKLVNDNYVNDISGDVWSPLAPNNQNSYSITFEGLLFHQQGGYSGQEKKDKLKIRKDNANIIAVAVGAGLAGLYGLFEMAQWFFHHFHWHLPF